MFNFNYELKSIWPKLSWVAIIKLKTKNIKILHGPMVEINNEWAVEGVWNGEFSSGDFDRTDIFFGSGLRLREDKIVFVTSGSTFDRLLYCDDGENFFISNTLPGLLSISDMQLIENYKNYANDSFSIVKGLENKISTIPTNKIPITKVYFNNLEFDLLRWRYREISKPDTTPNFKTYEQYRDFLFASAKALGKNSKSINRKTQIDSLSTISKGYDSCVASVVSKYAGCTRTATISKSSSFFGVSDSGIKIAKRLGMSCKEYPRTANYYPDEIALWAGEGRAGILNWTLFDFQEPLTLLFTGCHGEKVWDRVDHDHPDPFVRRDTSSHGFCELRLFRGVLQVPVPFFGIRKSNQIKKITQQGDMKKFYMNKDYDKPIARRIVEESGVPRHLFGTTNKNTSLESPFRWPYSMSALKSFQKYLLNNGVTSFSIFQIVILRIFFKLYHLFQINFGNKIGLIGAKTLAFKTIKGCSYIYQWANNTLVRYYR